MRLIRHLRSGFALLDARAFAAKAVRCPFCGPSLLLRLNATDAGVRCLRCAASAVQLTLGAVLREVVGDLSACDVCELSARGPLVEYLRRSTRSLATSEYFADLPSGTLRNGIRCEDVQRLSYAEGSFDVLTHTEVLEHVPDDALAFAELLRVLRPGGLMIFTVPMHGGERTIERARLREGVVEHVQPPVYHTDPLRGAGILAFRDYGNDILERLRKAGFGEAELRFPSAAVPWIEPRAVVVARKPVRVNAG